jgi:hypothetical protein
MLLIARTTPRADADGRFDGLSLFLAESDRSLDTIEVTKTGKVLSVNGGISN